MDYINIKGGSFLAQVVPKRPQEFTTQVK